MKKLLLAVLLSNSLAISAHAASATNNIQSNASLQSKCTISLQNISFGELNFILAPVNKFANGGLDILCSKNVSYVVTPENGFGKGNVFSMVGTNGNTDVVQIGMRKGPDNPPLSWDKELGKITGVGTGQVVSERIYAVAPYAGTPGADNGAPNQFNYQVKPDNYSATITTLITY